MTLKEESVIEMIAYTKDQEEFLRFSMIPITIQKMSYHTGCLYRDVTEERNQERKRTSDKRINSKQ
jgi:hypothetical protein